MKTRHLIVSALVFGSSVLAFAGFGLGDLVDTVAANSDNIDKAAKGASGLTIQEEINIGDSVSVEIVGRYGGIWKDKAATQRVNLVGRTLARYAKRESLDWRFGILNSEQINAFSSPNGRVFITKGLYKLLANDDELAAVLAHEIAHIDLRHAAKIIAGKQGVGAALAIGADVAGDQLAGSQYAALSPYQKELEGAVAKGLTGILTDGYGPDREYDADKEGYRLAKLCGFNPEGMRIVLTRIAATAGASKDTLNTHPKTSDRLKRLPGGEKKKGK